MSHPREHEDERRREALASLRSLGDTDTFATSAMARTARRTTGHFAGRDAAGDDGSVDRIELWGRRIGRGLSLVGFIGLAIYLYLTHFAGR